MEAFGENCRQEREGAGSSHRRPAIALATALALAISGCGGGANVRSSSSANAATFSGGSAFVGANQTVVWSQNFTGSIDLIKGGAGTLVLTGTNTYTGGTSINAGTLQIGNGGTTGSIVGDVKDDGSLVFDYGKESGLLHSFSGVISGDGNVVKMGGGDLALTGENTYTGGTTISGGTLQIGNDGTTGSITGNVTDNGILAFSRSDDVVFSGDISGGGSLNQDGRGTLILVGNNTYTGGTTISGGTLQVGNGGTVGSITGNVADNAYNGSLVFDRSDDWTYDGIISGSGDVVKLGGGTLTLSGANTYYGTTSIKNGTLEIAAGGALGSATSVGGDSNSASLIIDSGATVSGSVLLLDGGSLDNAGKLVTKIVESSAVQGQTLSSSVTVVNHDGGLIEGDSSQSGVYVPGISISDALIINEAGSTIRGYEGVETDGTVKNNGGSIIGISNDGVDGAAMVDNRNAGRILAGTGGGIHSLISIGVKSGVTSATVNNINGSTISGVHAGVWLLNGGTVTNDNNSSISGDIAIFISTASSASATVANNSGSTITGKSVGIELVYGGAVTNDPGATIEATDTPSADCSINLACSIYVPGDSKGSYGSSGSLTLTNYGTVIGNVQMNPTAVNHTYLLEDGTLADGTIQGDLDMGTNAQSTLTLGGPAGTTQSYSKAVTGTTTFAGKLYKSGDGTWIIDNSDLQAVTDTFVQFGSLLSTQMLSGNVNVDLGSLDGVPGVVGNLSSAGKVAVHGGDTTVGGDYVQSSAGTLAVSLGSKLDVAGTATLNGGTLEVTGADSGYVSNTHTTVLSAAGGVNGTFAKLVKDSGVVFTATTINYDANSAWLDTTGLNVTTAAAGAGVSYTPASMGSAVRVQGAFVQLDQKIAAGNLSGVSGSFLTAAGQFQHAPTLLAAQASLRSLSGQLHTVSAAMTFEAINASSRALSDRFDTLYDKGTGQGMWTHSLSISGDMARAGFDGVGFQLNGWLIGSDRRVGRSGVAGYAFGQSRGLQRLDHSVDHDDSRSTEGMLYAGWISGNWYTRGRVGLGHFRQDISRQILLGYSVQGVGTHYSGRYDVVRGESGLHLGPGRSHVTPFVNVAYERIVRDGFAEQGAGGFGLRSDARTLDRWQAGAGVRADRHWDLGSGHTVDVSASAQWQRTMASQGEAFDASFVGLQQWQRLVGIGLSRYSGLFDAGVDATLSAHTSLKFSYAYELGQRGRAQMLSAHLDMAF